MTVVHRERFDFVAGLNTGVFEAFRYSVNPGDVDTFPWLSGIANRYEKYKFKMLKFIYVPQCSTATAGTVSLVFDFDPNDAPPNSMTEALTYHDFTTGPAWTAQTLISDLKNGDRAPQKNTRSRGESQTELNNYDVGTLFVCTEGFASAAKLGYVEVEYSVEFFIHQIPIDHGMEIGQPAYDYGTTGGYTSAFVTPLPNLLQEGEVPPVREDPTTIGKYIFSEDFQGLAQWNIIPGAAGTDKCNNFSFDTNIATNRGTIYTGDVNTTHGNAVSMFFNAKKGEYIRPRLDTTAGTAFLLNKFSLTSMPYVFTT